MKVALILSALVFSAQSFAGSVCEKSCQKAFEKNSQICFQSMQYCLKNGPVGFEGEEMCREDFNTCLDAKTALKNSCIDSCTAIDD